MPGSSLANLVSALQTLPAFRLLAPESLEPTGFTGMAHDHIRIKGTGFILRVPRVSQWALPAEVNLAYQVACFRRAAPSGHAPNLHSVLAPRDTLPMGALIVEEIVGRKPHLPGDLPAIAECLRRVHSLPVPPPPDRRPLLSPNNVIEQLLRTIEQQARYLEPAHLDRAAEAAIRDELAWAHRFAGTHLEWPRPTTFILTDSHPGNFIIDHTGKAFFVDLEKAMYALPAIDLAHATLYTSTRFDAAVDAVLTREETAAFYRGYLAGIDPRLRDALRPWLAPLRRLIWLRTTTWCIKWRVASQGYDGWSRDRLDAQTLSHTEGSLADFFNPDTIARVRAEWIEGDPEAAVS